MKKPSEYTLGVVVDAAAGQFVVVEAGAACDTASERGPLVCEGGNS